jgi:hypothetical protein
VSAVVGSGLALLGAVFLGLVMFAAVNVQPKSQQPSPKPNVPVAGPVTPTTGPLVLTYYYYWYDAKTGQHLGPNDPLPTHPVDNPQTSWSSVAWHKQQLADMSAAGVDVVLPVYWGYSSSEVWSTKGLQYLVDARNQLVAEGARPPSIGMFFDSAILEKRDLRTPANIDFFYSNIKDFFSRIPANSWARHDVRPIVWIFLPQNGNAFNQSLFDYTYARFNADFGVRPFIVRATGWDCAIVSWDANGYRTDCSQKIQTDGSFVWGVAQDGTQPAGTVAAVGPGYDESKIPDRRGIVRSRDGGKWYQLNFARAITSHRDMLAIETWNEFHEASAICETKEYGRQYIDLTRQLTDKYRASFPSR